jgi:hypothetical protein
MGSTRSGPRHAATRIIEARATTRPTVLGIGQFIEILLAGKRGTQEA